MFGDFDVVRLTICNLFVNSANSVNDFVLYK